MTSLMHLDWQGWRHIALADRLLQFRIGELAAPFDRVNGHDEIEDRPSHDLDFAADRHSHAPVIDDVHIGADTLDDRHFFAMHRRQLGEDIAVSIIKNAQDMPSTHAPAREFGMSHNRHKPSNENVMSSYFFALHQLVSRNTFPSFALCTWWGI